MAGEFARKGNLRSLNAALMSQGALGAIGGSDIIGTINGAVAAGTAGVVSLTTSALTKAIPNNAVIVTIAAAGTPNTVQAWVTGAAAASGATSITVLSQTTRPTTGALAVGDTVALLSFPAYLALITTTTAPTDNSLGSELVFTGYTRQLVPMTGPTAADPPVTGNSGTVSYGPMSGAPTGSAVVTYVSLMDCPSGGTQDNQYAWWTLNSTRTPAAGDSLSIAPNGLTTQVFH